MDNRIDHLRSVLELVRANKLYANASKSLFGAKGIPFLVCFICKQELRADLSKLKAIVDTPVLLREKDLRQ